MCEVISSRGSGVVLNGCRSAFAFFVSDPAFLAALRLADSDIGKSPERSTISSAIALQTDSEGNLARQRWE